MTASVSQVSHQGDHYHQVRAVPSHALQLVKRAAAAVGRALMRWAVAYERTAQERIMRELALSHPSLVAEIRAARSTAAAEAARRSPVIGMWE